MVDPMEQVYELLDAAVQARAAGHRPAANAAVHALTDLADEGGRAARLLDVALNARLDGWIDVLWQSGWRPADVAHVVRRNYPSGPQLGLAVDCMAAALDGYDPSIVDGSFSAQLAALNANAEYGEPEDFVWNHAARAGSDTRTVIDAVVDLLALFSALHRLPPLHAPFGGAAPTLPDDAGSGGGADQKLLDRVRALLAKAEASDYGPEADAFTAKAQQLIVQHSLDQALLPGGGSGEEPGGIRIGLDSPYESEKLSLLTEIAAANRCRAVYSERVALVTVLGFPADLRAVELLYTSLLVQATRAMLREGPRRTRTRNFRQSFLRAFAVRIGARLRGVAESSVQEGAAADDRLLPVLASRDLKVEKLVVRLFPHVAQLSGSSQIDREGWALGTQAADLATLTALPTLPDEV